MDTCMSEFELELRSCVEGSEEFVGRCVELYSRLLAIDQIVFQEDVKKWCVCILYIVSTSFPSASRKSVTDVLTKTGVKCEVFMKSMHVIIEADVLSEAQVSSVYTLQQRYCIRSCIFDKFSRMWYYLFNEDPMSAPTQTTPLKRRAAPSHILDYSQSLESSRQAIWAMYLVAQLECPADEGDLASHFYILLACVEHVSRHLPSFLFAVPFDRLSLSSTVRSQLNEGFLSALCEKENVDHNEVLAAVCQTDKWASLLEQVRSSPDSPVNLDILKAKYRTEYESANDIDEMAYLDSNSSVLPQRPIRRGCKPQSTVSGGSSQSNGLDNSNSSLSSSSSSNGGGGGGSLMDNSPYTPIRFVMATIKELKDLLRSTEDIPSAFLLEYLQSCRSCDLWTSVRERVSELKDLYVRGYCLATESGNRTFPEYRFNLISRLYYRVMDLMVQKEESRPSKSDMYGCLKNQAFHVSLMACCVEVVNKTYGYSAPNVESVCAFPWILGVFSLEAVDLCRVIEPFIRTESKLNRDVTRHLQKVENSILEYLAWQEGSELFRMDRPASSASSSMSDGSSPPDVSTIPTPGSVRSLSSYMVSPAPGSAGSVQAIGDPRKRSQFMTVFMKKVDLLAYERLKSLCTNLSIPKDMVVRMWTCLQFCIHQKTELMKNRHLDQMMMCCLYGVCRVMDRDVTFKKMVDEYKKLPHARRAVYRYVYESEKNTISIIDFYNGIFSTSVKPYLMQFTTGNPLPAISSVPRSTACPMSVSPCPRVQISPNFTVSPMKEYHRAASGLMTPRTYKRYSFGELGGSSKLREINEAIKLSATPLYRAHQRFHNPIPGRSLGSMIKRKRLEFND